MSNAIKVYSADARQRASVFPVWSVQSGARYKKSWLPGDVKAPPGLNAIAQVDDDSKEEVFTLQDVLCAAEVINYSEWSKELAAILYLRRDDGSREELTKADREALIVWMAKEPNNLFTKALLEVKHPILFRNPFPDERILITNILGSKIPPGLRAANSCTTMAYDLGYAVGQMVSFGDEDEAFQMQVAILRDPEHSYFHGLHRGLNIIKQFVG